METVSKNLSVNKPLFSIIMPCYNSEDYVHRAIQSVINQTFDNWELVIINDGSTDETLNIVNSYVSQDSRIHVFSKANGGYVSAVNHGLDNINGQYFMLLGSDDEIRPSLFSNIYAHIKLNEKPDLIGFRTLIIKDDKTEINDKNSTFDTLAQEFNSDIKSFSLKYPKHSSIFFTRDTSKLYKTEILGELRYFGKKGMDADGIFSMMFSHKASSFLCVPEFGYIWYLRAESLSGRKKDYSTQIDRIQNWIKFGYVITSMDPSLITEQEKYYLVNYFYSIIKSVCFSFWLKCFNSSTITKSITFLKNIIESLDIKTVTQEIRFLLNHPLLWKFYIFPKVLFEKIKKLKDN